jgi:cysteinyl-tRNA synthetase
LTLRLYDTLTRSVSEFSEPINSKVKLVYMSVVLPFKARPHIGHLTIRRVVFDVLRRWLVDLGLKVNFGSQRDRYRRQDSAQRTSRRYALVGIGLQV